MRTVRRPILFLALTVLVAACGSPTATAGPSTSVAPEIDESVAELIAAAETSVATGSVRVAQTIEFEGSTIIPDGTSAWAQGQATLDQPRRMHRRRTSRLCRWASSRCSSTTRSSTCMGQSSPARRRGQVAPRRPGLVRPGRCAVQGARVRPERRGDGPCLPVWRDRARRRHREQPDRRPDHAAPRDGDRPRVGAGTDSGGSVRGPRGPDRVDARRGNRAKARRGGLDRRRRRPRPPPGVQLRPGRRPGRRHDEHDDRLQRLGGELELNLPEDSRWSRSRTPRSAKEG